MTCIVGYVKNGEVWIGGDSAGVSNLDIRVMSQPKVFIRDKMVFGYTSSFRMGQLLQYSLVIPLHEEGKPDHEYLCKDFIDSVKKCFKDNEYASKRNEVVNGGTFLLGYRGNIYKIFDDFQVSHAIDGYDACGCGSDYALGAMSILVSNNGMEFEHSPTQIINLALKSASYFSAGVTGPFHTVKI